MQKTSTLQGLSTLFRLGCLLGITILAYLRWVDVVTPDGKNLTVAREKEIADRIDRLQNAQLYVLRAEINGYFLCPKCPPETARNGKYYLKVGESYKYGVTINPNERYSKAELARFRLNYLLLATGPLEEMLAKESILIGQYATLPENLARPKALRLAIPPGSGVDLR